MRLTRSGTWFQALIFGAIWAAVTAFGSLDFADRLVYDLRMRTLPRPAPASDLVVVALDEESLTYYGSWPWSRDIQAQLLDRLVGARGVMWDIILGDDSRIRGHDEAMARSLRRQGHVVLAAGANNTGDGGSPHALPILAFRQAASGIGFVRFHPDPDGVVRGAEATDTDPAGQTTLPMLHLAFAKLMQPALAAPSGRVYFNFQGPGTIYPTYSAAQVLDGDVPASAFQGKFVVVGASAEGLNDCVITPFEVMSGVVFNAQASVSWARGDWRRRLPPWVAIAGTGVLAAATVAIWELLAAAQAVGVLAALWAVLLGADLAVFQYGHTWLPTAAFAIASIGSLLFYVIVGQWRMAAQLRNAIQGLLFVFRKQQLSYAGHRQVRETALQRLPIREQVSALLTLTTALSEEWHLFQTLIAANQNPVVVCDAQQDIMLCNPSALALFGEDFAAGNLRQSLSKVLDEESLGACDDAFAQIDQREDASPPGLLQWEGRAFRLTFMKMSAVSGALCLFEDVTVLHRRANIDGLTGLWNRRYFDEMFLREVERFRRHGLKHPVSLIMVDVDHFKKVNDTHGHQIGDQVLVMVADALKRLVRSTDLAVRYGGEEMCMLLPETDLAGAGVLAERVREEIAGLVPLDAQGQPFRVTASFGVASCRPGETDTTLLARADLVMYASKEGGRNRVTLAED